MKALLIIAQKGFQDHEYFPTKEILEKNNIETVTASITTEQAIGKYGEKVKPDISINDADPDHYDVIVLIGGPGTLLLDIPELYKILSQAKKIIAAICMAPVLLAKANLLKYKKATVWNEDSMQSVLIERQGAQYIPEPVVIDGNIITANGPDAAQAFGNKIVEALKNVDI